MAYYTPAQRKEIVDRGIEIANELAMQGFVSKAKVWARLGYQGKRSTFPMDWMQPVVDEIDRLKKMVDAHLDLLDHVRPLPLSRSYEWELYQSGISYAVRTCNWTTQTCLETGGRHVCSLVLWIKDADSPNWRVDGYLSDIGYNQIRKRHEEIKSISIGASERLAS